MRHKNQGTESKLSQAGLSVPGVSAAAAHFCDVGTIRNIHADAHTKKKRTKTKGNARFRRSVLRVPRTEAIFAALRAPFYTALA